MALAAGALDKLPGYLGHAVLAEDGSVVSSGGDLAGEQDVTRRLHALYLRSCQYPLHGSSGVGGGGAGGELKRVTVNYPGFFFALTSTGGRVYLVKRHRSSHQQQQQEPVMA